MEYITFCVFVAVLLLLVFTYQYYKRAREYKRAVFLMEAYSDWVEKAGKSDFISYRAECLQLFSDTGIKGGDLIVTQRIVSQSLAFKGSSLENFPILRYEFVNDHYEMFEHATGELKRRKEEIMNLIFWIDCIVFLPKKVMEYIGINQETASARALYVILTVFWWVFSVLLTLYLPHIKLQIINLLSQ